MWRLFPLRSALRRGTGGKRTARRQGDLMPTAEKGSEGGHGLNAHRARDEAAAPPVPAFVRKRWSRTTSWPCWRTPKGLATSPTFCAADIFDEYRLAFRATAGRDGGAGGGGRRRSRGKPTMRLSCKDPTRSGPKRDTPLDGAKTQTATSDGLARAGSRRRRRKAGCAPSLRLCEKPLSLRERFRLLTLPNGLIKGV